MTRERALTVAEWLQVFADPVRLLLLNRLAKALAVGKELSVTEVADGLGLTTPERRLHLRYLVESLVVAVRKDGQRRFLSLARHRIDGRVLTLSGSRVEVKFPLNLKAARSRRKKNTPPLGAANAANDEVGGNAEGPLPSPSKPKGK